METKARVVPWGRIPPPLAAFGALLALGAAAAAIRPPLGIWLAATTAPLAWLALALAADRRSAASLSLQFLTPASFRVAVAVAEVMLPVRRAAVGPEEIARSLDRALLKMSAGGGKEIRSGLITLRFLPLLYLRPPFDLMSPVARRRFIERRCEAVAAHRVPEPLRRVQQALVRLARQASVIGYYTVPQAREAHGYVPFHRREHRDPQLAGTAARPLQVDEPASLEGERVAADVVVVGSGAGGAIAAYRLAEAGRSVLVLERGKHHRPQTFTEDEAGMLGALFGYGAAQVSRDFRLQVMQASCVGGSTVVNNGVCFDLPEHTLREWNDPCGLDAGLDEALLAQSFKRVRRLIGVRSQDYAPRNGAARKLEEGVRALDLDRDPFSFGAFDANIHDCIGCGLCNFGCSYGAKQSMLESVLPFAQRRFQGRVRIVSEAQVVRIRRRGGRATGVSCRLADGRSLEVTAETVVVAAGALHSSALLQRSGLGRGRAGRGLTHNLALPLMGVFDDEVNSFDGLQMSHYLQPPPECGYIIESWAQPIAAHAAVLGGWFEEHFETMSRYPNTAAGGVVVGSERGGSWVRHSPLARRPTFAFKASRRDVSRLVEGTALLGEIFFAAGAKSLVPATYRGTRINGRDELQRFGEEIRDGTDMIMSTSHPQGGNPLSANPRIGVLDEEFRVRGTDNVHVCDASAFPGSITVNPQLTVMALADYAAGTIAQTG